MINLESKLVDDRKQLLLAVLGPTASGKSDWALQLATHFNTAILSADSRQLYREMSVGVAKPSKEELAAVKHYFIDHCSIHETYTAGMFENEALDLLSELFREKNLVILCGGSGLYVNAVCDGFDDIPPTNPLVRTELEKLLQEGGILALQNKLQQADPEYFREVDRANPRRLLRALEVIQSSGIKYSQWRSRSEKKRPFHCLKIGIDWPREELYARIDRRVDQMMKLGLLMEAENLYKMLPNRALETVGYQELFAHFRGECSLSQAVEKIKQHSRNYAKRQLTWFKRHPDIHWFRFDQLPDVYTFIEANLR